MSEQELLAEEIPFDAAGDDSAIRPYCVNNITSDPVDPETVKKAIDGDDEAFSKLFWQTYRYVYGIAKRYLHRDEDIYDAIQETYTSVYSNLGKLKAPEAFVNWVGKIAVTCSRTMAEKTAAAGADTFDDDDLVEIDDTHDEFKKDVVIDVTAVLSQLDAADAELLTYVYYDRLKVTEIARMQGVPATTVYSRLNAAKQRLKELLKIRGIEKAVYGGDLVAIITTALRNAIGTNLLSMAVAAEILHSVTGKKSKAAAVVAAVARKQRNAAALKIASWLLATAVLVFGVITLVFYSVKSSLDSTPSNDGLTAGVSTEIESSFENTNSASSYFGNSSIAGNSVGGGANGNQNGTSSAESQEGISSNTGGNANIGGNIDGTSSSGTTSTGTSGEIGGTDEPGQGNGGSGNNGTGSSSTLASSQRTSTNVSTTTSSSKPSSSSSAASSSASSVAASSGFTSSSSQSSTPTVEEIWKVKKVADGVEIKGINTENSSGIYEIPAQIGGMTVVGIGDMAFYYESGIKSITLPETVQYIGEQAFANANGITSIVLPSSVTEIKSNAFMSCMYLSDVYIKSTNVTIATYAFSDYYNRNVTLTIHAPASTMTAQRAKVNWDAQYEEWYG